MVHLRMEDSDFDDTDYATEARLPTPGDTPYNRTPMLSRHASRGPSPSPYPMSSSPAPSHPPNHNRMSISQHHDGSFDENISILDPRRFTPTLHANLVAEILSLRREIESKSNLVDSLEHDLEVARTENEAMTSSAATAMKEARDVKRQLARAEQDDAVGAVAQERDEAVEALAEMKKQVDRLTKHKRIAEEDLERTKEIQERDSEKFQDAKRVLERRAHVAEGRLKAVLDEIAAHNAMPPPPAPPHGPHHQRVMSEDSVDFAHSDTASVRSIRLERRPTSLLMGDDEAEKLGISLHGNGLSLADELEFDQSDEDQSTEHEADDHYPHTDADHDSTPAEMVSDGESVEDPEELPELADMGIQVAPEINYEAQILILEDTLDGKTAELESVYRALDQKKQELDTLYGELDKSTSRIDELETQVAQIKIDTSHSDKELEEREAVHRKAVEDFESRKQEQTMAMEELSISLELRSSDLENTEKQIQDRVSALEIREKKLKEIEAIEEPGKKESSEVRGIQPPNVDQDRPREGEYEANIRRKRASGMTSPPLTPAPWTTTSPAYVSVESQTTELPSPPSPPRTPEPQIPEVIMQTAGTQTDCTKPLKPSFIHVPAIMVSPPEPTPPLPRPIMKNACVQTRPMRVRTHSMQTEEIRLDERLRKFAPHLIPPALLAKEKDKDQNLAPERPPPSPPHPPRKSSKRMMKRVAATPVPENASTSIPAPRLAPMNDGGAGTAVVYTSDDRWRGSYERNKRESSRTTMSGNFDPSERDARSSCDDDFPDIDQSDNEYNTVLSAPRPKRQQRNGLVLNTNFSSGDIHSERYGGYVRRQPSMRKNALVTSGVQVHARGRSPSLTSSRTTESGGTGTTKIGPPFPVPARHSSKRPGYLSDRDRERANASPTPRLQRNVSKARHGRQHSIRKVRSTTALPGLGNGQPRARSPPPVSPHSRGPESPGLTPPLPRDEVSSPAFDRRGFGQPRHRQQASNNTVTTGQASVGNSGPQTSVVDAIAQTMVGEWMWKYVRRRRSFGVGESPQNDDAASGQRHKRWVWLAPYERAVMWSSRQPTSGTALLGKSGRKLLIQSVLDVKDDTPLTKGSNQSQVVFNRSILILTPARALKFTAPNKERHYVWLTALSFLSHSADANDGLLALPPPMPFEYEQMQQQPQPPPVPPSAPAKLNAFSSTRDSVRLAKGKNKATPSAIGHIGIRNGSFGVRAMESQDSLSAEPPSIPRFPGHSRRRSNTHMRPQTRSTSHGYERSLASYATSNAGSVTGDQFYGVGGIGLTSANSSMAHGIPGHDLGGSGWETGPMGTVRMEAFIEKKPTYEFDEIEEPSSGPSSYRLRRDRRASRQESYWSGSGGFYNEDEDDFFKADDPFKGF